MSKELPSNFQAFVQQTVFDSQNRLDGIIDSRVARSEKRVFTYLGFAFAIVSLGVAFGGAKYIEWQLEKSVSELAKSSGMVQMDSTAKIYMTSIKDNEASSRVSLEKIKEVQTQTDDIYKFLPAGSVIASVLTPERFFVFVNKNYWAYADGASKDLSQSRYAQTTGWTQIVDLRPIQPKASNIALYYYIKIN